MMNTMGSNPIQKIIKSANLGLPGRCNMGSYMFLGATMEKPRGWDADQFHENYNTPLEHTPGNPPTQLWKDSLYNLLVKV